MSDPLLRHRAEALFARLQDEVCARLEELDGAARFGRDEWRRPGGGGGTTRVLADGAVFEKGACNVSTVWGPAPPALVEHLGVAAGEFFATGISMIFHPRNPHAPTMHANLRYFECDGGAAWFGGGQDLTPYYLYADDVRAFHRNLADCCARHEVADYPAWKAWCDRYFHLPCRGEARGVGGIFYDHVRELEPMLAFSEDFGEHLLAAYAPIVARRRETPTTPAQERWHLLRRGRYVEFNLLYDRGTRFGLQTGGRTESILVSLPPRVRWDYLAEPAAGTPERELLDLLRGPPRDWL
ncbi:MAG: oxygen-dependent coproporphyrinogen oxidase [Planctomycetota bacterium]|nr:MAG: oxygen-dependent coproporphyrinogen oxidase [Planctomycetota bacterium]